MPSVADAGPDRDGALPSGRLILEGEPSLTLAFGEEAPLVVRYLEDDVAVADTTIRFALEGSAHDATIGHLSRTTDGDGYARTSVIAGSTVAVFRVRATTELAAPLYVNVSVGNMGVGTLVVGATYSGARDGATRRVIEVYSDVTCAEPRPAFQDRVLALEDPAEAEARFRALPVGPSYAVVGRVESSGGTTLASACVDGVQMARDSETRVDLAFEDEVLVIAGEYDAILTFGLTTPNTSIRDAAQTAAQARIDAAGSVAAFYLDALEEHLRALGKTSAADALALARQGGGPEADLGLRIEMAGGGPMAALSTVIDQLTERLMALTLRGTLTIGDALPTWTVSELGSSTPSDLLVAASALDLMPLVVLRWQSASDSVAIESMTFVLALGTLALALLDAEKASLGLDLVGELLASSMACDPLVEWVAANTTLSPDCDGQCARAACVRALGELMDAVAVALSMLDESRRRISMSGNAAASDLDGDLLVDRIHAPAMTGLWTPLLGATGDAVAGELSATRLTP